MPPPPYRCHQNEGKATGTCSNDGMQHSITSDNLDHDIDPAQLARITLTSDYHFRRVFSALAGIPLSTYIRQRRMSLAAADILAGNGVLDVATMYGYSGDAFTRAFRDMHGVPPSHARKPGTTLRSRPPLAIT